MLVGLAGGGLLIIKDHILEKNIIVKRYNGKKNIGEKAQALLSKKGASIFIIWVLNTFALVVTL